MKTLPSLCLALAIGAASTLFRLGLPDTLPVPRLAPRRAPVIQDSDEPSSPPTPASSNESQPAADSAAGLSPDLEDSFLALWEFIQTGQYATVARLTPGEVAKLAHWLVYSGEINRFRELIASATGLPADRLPGDKDQMVKFLTAWFDAASGRTARSLSSTNGTRPPTRVSPIGFATERNEYGHVVATSPFVEAGSKRVYGVLPNAPERTPEVVLTVWRDLERNEVVQQRAVRLRPDLAVNYVSFSPGGSWPAGHWAVDVYDPARDFAPVASGLFVSF